MGKYYFIKNEKGEPVAYKCVCGKISRLSELELLKFDCGLQEGRCPHCMKGDK